MGVAGVSERGRERGSKGAGAWERGRLSVAVWPGAGMWESAPLKKGTPRLWFGPKEGAPRFYCGLKKGDPWL